jgi:tetratricopeptide (TPR) repeat protein
MSQHEFRIFLSAVTSEFGRARDAVAADLRSREALLRVQSDFRQEAGSDTTLQKLHDYIRDCSAVVCVIGKRSGALPPPKAAEPFAHMLPSGIAKASYTQWEFFFARHFKRRLWIYVATDDYQPDLSAPTGEDDPELQRAFCDHIVKEEGLDRSYFANEDQLARAVLKEDWPKKSAGKPIALPYPSLGSLFKGRDAFLKELHASLSRGSGRTAIVGSALYGLGGIGKTRAAVEYAWAHQQDYTALLFVIAETPEALRCNLAALAGPLVLNLPEQHATEEDVRLKGVLDWLKEHPGWFLILDNLDAPEALEEAEKLLSTLSGGRVLITSRLGNFAGHFDPLELDVLSVEDAAAFLLERTDRRRHKTPDDAATARQLAVDLGGLALALEQAGAYVAKLGVSFSRYRELWRENWDKVAACSDERITKYPRAVAVTWQTSVNQLAPAGRRLLERLAWFAPEPIPNFLLEVPVPDVAGDDLEHGPIGLPLSVSSPGLPGRSSNHGRGVLDRPVKPGDDSIECAKLIGDTLADALANLADYSLARRNADKQEFSVHRLVQDVTRRGLVEQERRRSLVEALAWVNAAFVGDPTDVRTWPRLDPIEPHGRTIVQYADGAEINEPTAVLMNQLGMLLQAKARYREAEPLFRRALAIDETSYGPDDPDVAIRLNNLAELLQDTNRLSESEPLYWRALAIDAASYGSDHPIVAIRLNNLGKLLYRTNRLSDAEPLFRRALAIDEASYSPDHPNVARSLNNLALLLGATNRLSDAEPLLRRALAIDEARYGPDHPNVATSLNNLALLLRATNWLSDAEPLLRRALAINEASCGPDHPNVAKSLEHLVSSLGATNRLSDAEPLLRRALAIDEASYGPDHPDVATGLNNLASLLRATDRLNDAAPLYRQALAILVRFERATCHRHPNLEVAWGNYVQALDELGRTRAEVEAAVKSVWEDGRSPPP